LFDLTISNPTVCGFTYPAQALLSPLADPRSHTYDPDPRGLPSAREAVALYYASHRAPISPGDLILTTSTSEAYSFVFRLLCDPGDDLLIARPSYPLFDFLADLDDVRLRPYPLFYDHGWWIDFAELERAIGPRTRAIVVVHPNNPTGHATSRAERAQLEALCARHRLALIVDEVFLDYPMPGAPAIESFAVGPHPVPTFVLSGMSKIAGLPQMKSAWIAVCGPANGPAKPEALARLEVIADTFLSMNAPVQLALPTWLANREQLRAQIGARVADNLRIVSAAGVPMLQAEAGWSATLRLPQRSLEVATDLLARRVVVHPGEFYGMAERGRAVISLIGPSDDLREGIAIIRQFCAE
ncbi:MAG TPA: pyridoxal phosphate-dependent aminotransferase, partial [Thermoanaerobaculia bacterium]|nr:pyridoxal phosphate-dependent aminotransferase [Thermoanaerobaculia bacterium]